MTGMPEQAPCESLDRYHKRLVRWQDFQLGRNGAYDRLPFAEPPATPTPTCYLTSWREILIALGMKNNKEDREKVRNLNAQYGGPIVIPKQGSHPKANREKLIEWWNGLEAQWAAGYQRGRDAKPTAEVQHPYGRDGTAAPEIGGSVKKRRNAHRE